MDDGGQTTDKGSNVFAFSLKRSAPPTRRRRRFIVPRLLYAVSPYAPCPLLCAFQPENWNR
jgi:hypothetical protein